MKLIMYFIYKKNYSVQPIPLQISTQNTVGSQNSKQRKTQIVLFYTAPIDVSSLFFLIATWIKITHYYKGPFCRSNLNNKRWVVFFLICQPWLL